MTRTHIWCIMYKMRLRNNRRFELRKPKSETAECADCSESEDEGGITRRDLLMLAGFTAGAVFADRKLGATDALGRLVADWYTNLTELGPDDQMKIKLGIVAIFSAEIDPDSGGGSGTDKARRWGREKINLIAKDNIDQIERTLDRQYQFDIEYIERNEEPEGIHRDGDGREQPTYTADQFARYAEEERDRLAKESGDPTLVIALFDSHRSELSENYTGLAFTPELRIHVSTYGDWNGSVFAHEVGHLLYPSERFIGRGLGHEGRLDGKVLADDGLHLKHLYCIDTIQKLIAEAGCKLDANEYASHHTVMGSGYLNPNLVATYAGYSSEKAEEDRQNLPIYSPPEMFYLQPWRIVGDIDKPGTYPLSYEKDKTFALQTKLPGNHVLRQAISYADKMFIGLNVESADPGETPTSSNTGKNIGVYAVSEDGRRTAEISTTCFATGGLELGDEEVVYADEQLNILLIAGKNIGGEYARILALDTNEAQEMLREAREKTAERDEILVRKYNEKVNNEGLIAAGASGFPESQGNFGLTSGARELALCLDQC